MLPLKENLSSQDAAGQGDTPGAKKLIKPVLRVTIAMLALMTAFETTKQLVAPRITIWQSHTVTIIFSTIIATAAAYFVLRNREEANARLYAAQRNIADTLQEALLTMPQKIKGIDFGHFYRSATATMKVGGDFYDLFELEHDRVGIVIGDVSGKGLQASSLTSLVKNAIKAYAYQEKSPASIMAKANVVVQKESIPAIFITVFFGILDIKTGRLVYCSAGHPPGILKRTTSETSPLTTSSPMIGAFSALNYIDDKVDLKKGDALILYTDGVIEARNNGELFGEEKLVSLIKDLDCLETSKLPRAIIGEITDFTGGKLSDDVAILTVSLK